MREYRLARGWKIFFFILIPPLIGLFIWLLIMPLIPSFDTEPTVAYYLIVGPFSVGFIFLLIVGMIDAVKSRVVIDREKIMLRSVLANRELKFDEIRGYRYDSNYIFILPKTKDKKRIKISTYFGKSRDIIFWLDQRYSDVTVQRGEDEMYEILGNERYGRNFEEREKELQLARRRARIMNWTGWITSGWVLFYPTPYTVAVSCVIIVPLVAIVVLRLSKGLIRVDEIEGTAYPSIYPGLIVPSVVILLRALFDYNVFDLSNAWPYLIVLTAVLLAVILPGSSEFNLRKAYTYLNLVILTASFLAYSYGTMITLNCHYDRAPPEIFVAKVIDKRVSSGKTTSYYFRLTRWGPQRNDEEAEVTRALYEGTNISDSVSVYFMKGEFNIPWYDVESHVRQKPIIR